MTLEPAGPVEGPPVLVRVVKHVLRDGLGP